VPPRLRRFAIHKARHGDERVEQARVVDHAGLPANAVIHRVRVLARQVRWLRDAKQHQVLAIDLPMFGRSVSVLTRLRMTLLGLMA